MKKKNTNRQDATKKPVNQQARRARASTRSIALTFYLFALGVIIAGGFLLYASILDAPFVFDDGRAFRDNAHVHINSLSQLPDILSRHGIIRSVGYVTFAVNFYLGGLNPFGYHLLNIVIHLLNALTLFLIVVRTLNLPTVSGRFKTDASKIALLGALLWLAHPVQIMAVTYTAQRFASLSAFFFLFSLFGYIRGRTGYAKNRWLWFGLSFAAGVLAFGTKQNTALLPFIILLYEFYFFMDLSYKGNGKKLLFGSSIALLSIGVLSVFYLREDVVITLSHRFAERGWTPFLRLITEMRVVVHYITLLLYPDPSRLNVDYDFSLSSSLFAPPSTFLSLVLLAALVLFAVYRARRNRLLSFCVLWFFANLAIESTVIPLDLVFEHRVYLPSMGPIVLLSGWIFTFKPPSLRKLGVVFSIVVLLLFSYWTQVRNAAWRDPVALWEDTAGKSPNKSRVHGNLGKALRDASRLEEAAFEFERSLGLGFTDDYDLFATYENLGAIYVKMERYDQAKACLEKALNFEKALRLDPADPDVLITYNNLALVYMNHLQQYAKAAEILHGALSRSPTYADAYLNLGVINLRLRQLPEAIMNFEKLLKLDPDNLLGHFNLAAAYFNLGDYEKAISILDRGISIWPGSSELYGLLGLVYFEKKEWEHAEKALKKAVSLDPANAMAVSYIKRLQAAREEK